MCIKPLTQLLLLCNILAMCYVPNGLIDIAAEVEEGEVNAPLSHLTNGSSHLSCWECE